MNVKYSLSGLDNETTVVEFLGPVYMLSHLISKNYYPKMVKIHDGRLALNMIPKKEETGELIASIPRHYVSLKPNNGVVGLRLCTTRQLDGEHSHVTFFVVNSVSWFGKRDVFRLERWHGIIGNKIASKLPLSASSEQLEDFGLLCSYDRLVDDRETVVLFGD